MNLRSLAAAVLALPVLAAVYLRVVTGSRTATRLAVVVALAMAAASVGVLAPTAGSGRTPAPEVPAPPPGAFMPIVAPVDVTSATAAAAVGRGAAAGLAPRTPTADRTGEIALAAAQPLPAVVRFRPRDGSEDVAAPLEVSVRFSQPMDRSSTTPAFTVQLDGTPLAGTARWAEYDTVLVVRLERRPPAGARVRLAVSGAARSAFGKSLEAAAEATFTIAAPPPSPKPTASPRPAAVPRASSSGWSWPLVGPITQRFGQSLTKYGYHQGIDIDGDTGDPVRAARAGRVTLAGRGDSCGGIQVHIDHGGGIETWYRHLSALSVRLGQRVDGGQVVGKVGNTGCSLGSHLHFAVRRDGEFVDPLRYLPRR